LLMGFIAFVLVIAKYGWRYAFELVVLPLFFGIGEGVFIFVLAGNFKNSGIGGLSEIHCQLCGIVGLIFWILFAFVLIIGIYGLIRKYCKCTKDKQRGMQIKTLRDQDSSLFRISETELAEQGSGFF